MYPNNPLPIPPEGHRPIDLNFLTFKPKKTFGNRKRKLMIMNGNHFIQLGSTS